MGLIVNADYQLWDYRENFANIGGQACLQNTTAFGVVAADGSAGAASAAAAG